MGREKRADFSLFKKYMIINVTTSLHAMFSFLDKPATNSYIILKFNLN